MTLVETEIPKNLFVIEEAVQEATELGRNRVREALMELQAFGLGIVERIENRGTRIAILSQRELKQMAGLWISVESHLAVEAANLIKTDPKVEADLPLTMNSLMSANKHLIDLLSKGKKKDWDNWERDVRVRLWMTHHSFHREVCKHAGNDLAAVFVGMCCDNFRLFGPICFPASIADLEFEMDQYLKYESLLVEDSDRPAEDIAADINDVISDRIHTMLAAALWRRVGAAMQNENETELISQDGDLIDLASIAGESTALPEFINWFRSELFN